MNTILIYCTGEDDSIPIYGTSHASGADLRAKLESPIVIEPGKRALVPTGLRIQIPEGYEAQVRPRSGLAVKNGIIVVNSPGTIDADYRGEIKIIIANLGEEDFTVSNGDRIAQMVFAPVVQANFIVKDSLGDTQRGDGGFGSTGIN